MTKPCSAEETRDDFVDRMFAEADARESAYREAHKGDPCETCGSWDDVEIIPTGSLAKLASMCLQCRKVARAATDAYHAGYDRGFRAAKSRSWWRRLLNR